MNRPETCKGMSRAGREASAALAEAIPFRRSGRGGCFYVPFTWSCSDATRVRHTGLDSISKSWGLQYQFGVFYSGQNVRLYV